MSPRSRSVTDDVVLAAASTVIGRVGPARLTLAAVADEAGLSAATLVQRFGTRRGLLLAVSSAWPDTVEAVFADADGLLDALGRLAAMVGTPDEAAHHLAFLAIDLSDPEFRVVAAEFQDRLRNRVAAALDGDEARADLVLIAYQGTLLTWSIAPEGSVTDRVRSVVSRILEVSA